MPLSRALFTTPFDLKRFRALAFGRGAVPDHPLQSVADVEEMLGELPGTDPAAALAELTHWARSINATLEFTPGRRSRVLMMLDDAARSAWRALGARYLAANGKPGGRGSGERAILRALFDSASEFADGFALVLEDERRSEWVKDHLALLYIRNMRWLARRLALSHMLHLSAVGAIWERLHRLQAGAESEKVARAVLPAFEGNRFPSSPRQEYARALLLELALPEAMEPRAVELAYRIAGRVASAVQLEPAPSDITRFAVIPAGDSRPAPLEHFGRNAVPAPLYIAAASCLPKLRAMLERDLGRDASEPDALFGGQFTLRERTALIERLLRQWGMDPPRRRMKRVPMASAAHVLCGLDSIAAVLPALNTPRRPERGASADLQLVLDDTSRRLRRSQLRAARLGSAHVVDASNGGLGIAIRRSDASWVAHRALVGVQIEPGKQWLVGVLRRVFAIGDELRLGIQVLATQPRVLTLSTETSNAETVWEEATWFEPTFKQRFRRAILLEPQATPLTGGQLLLSAGLASRNTQFDVPLPSGTQRIRITQMHEANEHYQRVSFEPLGAPVAAA
jgi:hypothetical protein